MILVGDLGGTKTHFAVYDPYNRVFEKKYKNTMFSSFIEILKDFLSLYPEKFDVLCLGIAGPIKDEKCKMSNLDWVVSKEDIFKNTHIKKVILVNDLEAFGYGASRIKRRGCFFYITFKKKSKMLINVFLFLEQDWVLLKYFGMGKTINLYQRKPAL